MRDKVCIIFVMAVANSEVALRLPYSEPSTHDSELSSNLDRDCVQVLGTRMPDNERCLPREISKPRR